MVQPKFNATHVEKYLELIELIGFMFGFPQRDEHLITTKLRGRLLPLVPLSLATAASLKDLKVDFEIIARESECIVPCT